MARKRSFREMSHNGSPITIIKRNIKATTTIYLGRKLRANRKPKNGVRINPIKLNHKFINLGNPKPRKRRKLHHFSQAKCPKLPTIIDSKLNSPSITDKPSKSMDDDKAPILHHCVLNERWNMLTSKKNTENKPSPKASRHSILGILNEYQPKPPSISPPKTKCNDMNYMIHCQQLPVIATNTEETESVSSYETSCYSSMYGEDGAVPSMSIADSIDTDITQSEHNNVMISEYVQNRTMSNDVGYNRPFITSNIPSKRFNDSTWSHNINANYPLPPRQQHEYKWHHTNEQQIQSQIGDGTICKLKERDKDYIDYLISMSKNLLYISIGFGMMQSDIRQRILSYAFGDNDGDGEQLEEGKVVSIKEDMSYSTEWVILTVIVVIIVGAVLLKQRRDGNRRGEDGEVIPFKFDYEGIEPSNNNHYH